MKIPHYYEAMVANYRRNLSIPDSISDEEILLKWKELNAMNEEDIIACMKEDFNLD
jgi:hypothetical protein